MSRVYLCLPVSICVYLCLCLPVSVSTCVCVYYVSVFVTAISYHPVVLCYKCLSVRPSVRFIQGSRAEPNMLYMHACMRACLPISVLHFFHFRFHVSNFISSPVHLALFFFRVELNLFFSPSLPFPSSPLMMMMMMMIVKGR